MDNLLYKKTPPFFSPIKGKSITLFLDSSLMNTGTQNSISNCAVVLQNFLAFVFKKHIPSLDEMNPKSDFSSSSLPKYCLYF